MSSDSIFWLSDHVLYKITVYKEMPSKSQAAASKRLRAAHANFIKVHATEITRMGKAISQGVKRAKIKNQRASGSVPAGRLRKKRRKKAGKMVMGFDVGPGWKKGHISAQRKAATAYQNKKNAAINRAARLRSDVRKAGDRAVYG